MVRKIIKIDEEKCDGCGLCAEACHEGAIVISDGKAKLIRDDYCDGLGDCLPVCPVDAISFEEREAAAYDEEAVKAKSEHEHKHEHEHEHKHGSGGCPGSAPKAFDRNHHDHHHSHSAHDEIEFAAHSMLNQWPVQIKLAPVNAPYFNDANLLVAADCAAYAYGNFHNKYMKNKITLIGCPKLDDIEYSEKLTEIISNNEIKSVTVARMEVPCCAGIADAVKKALIDSGKMIPWQIVTISTDGRILDE